MLAPARQHMLRQEYAAASSTYQRVLKQQAGTARDYYQAARAAAQNQESKIALELLSQAVDKGYYTAESLRAEVDFVPLRTQPTWNRLLARAQAKQKQHEAGFNQPLVALLKKIYQQDQQFRIAAREADKKFGLDSPQMRAAMQQQGVVDRRLIRQIDSLIARHGYPGKSFVGEYEKDVAFFVIQHNPNDNYLPLLTAAADKGEFSKSAFALFDDRTRTERGEKQLYGSQTHCSAAGKCQLYPIEDEANVDVRRAKLGMIPLEEYLQQFGITYQVSTATHNPNPPEIYVDPRQGIEQKQAAEEKSDVELIGGYKALYASLRYPAAAQKKQVRGSVTLQMVIDKTGIPQDVAVVKSLGYNCDEEALRVMRTARYTNSAGQDHEIRVNLPFPYEPKAANSEK
ncbi:energy transducer TonB [Hymenobacter volaticus]|uniref:TonB family protein n=1 Tax=Hymenobacter volaticus TaxID=2932254 RepID=A0ABY4G9H7_9BACT|nr:energy transducer TonB [Hymenobacter volaticus]UOQ67411.1 TonB family protein [Hymenobacter volaticus]